MRGPTAADLQTTFGRQVETLAKRVRGFTTTDWAAAAADGSTNADVVARLLGELEEFCAGVELRADDERPGPPDGGHRRPADLGLGLGLEDVGERLLELLRKTEATDPVWHPRGRVPARTLAAVALAETVLARWDVTGPGDRGPEPRAARLVLQGLFSSRDDSGASPVALLLHVTGRRRIDGLDGWGGDGWQYDLGVGGSSE